MMIENPILESGITVDELAEWKRLFESAPLDGISHATAQGDVVNLNDRYSMEKATALAAFLNAARTGWPRTMLELEAMRRDLSACEHAQAERDELRAQLNESNYHASRAISERAGFALEVDSLRAQLNSARLCVEVLKITEWFDEGDDEWYCPWCGNYKRNGHGSGCQRQIALRAAAESGLLDSPLMESVESHDSGRLAPVSPRLSAAWDHGDHYGDDDDDDDD